jgi:hypothetical protein
MSRGTKATCPTCKLECPNISQYVDHYGKNHCTRVQVVVLCPHCPSEKKLFCRRALYDHIKSLHPTNEVMKCKDCGDFIPISNVNAHLKFHAAKDYMFRCPYGNCTLILKGESDNFIRKSCIAKLNKHLKEDHGPNDNIPTIDASTAVLQNFNTDQDQEDVWSSNGDDEDFTAEEEDQARERSEQTEFHKKFWALWLKCEFINKIPESQMTELIQGLTELVEESSRNLRRRLKAAPLQNVHLVDEIFERADWLSECLREPNLASSYGRQKQAASVCNILQVRVNTTYRTENASNQTDILNVSLEDTIRQALVSHNWDPDKNGGFPEEMEHVKKMRRNDERVIAGYRDSVRYQEVEATVPVNERPAIHLQLYSDELDRDKMGFSSGRNKIHATYLKIHNLTDGIRRSPEDYHLIQIMPSFTLKNNGYQRVMVAMLHELSSLVKEGIQFRNRKHAVRLATLQGDGLERAAMFGMLSNFSKVTFCDPLSYLTTKTRMTCESVADLLPEVQQVRTKEKYKEDVLALRAWEEKAEELREQRELTAGRKKIPPKFEDSHGLKYDSPFNDVPHFHVADKGAVVYCIAHDLYAGAFRSDTPRVIVSLCDNNYFTWNNFQEKFRTYRKELRHDDRQGWYDVIPIKSAFTKLPGNHSSNHLVIRMLSSLFINRASTDPMFKTTAWSLYLAMKRVSELVSLKVVSEENLDQLDAAVKRYLEVSAMTNMLSASCQGIARCRLLVCLITAMFSNDFFVIYFFRLR